MPQSTESLLICLPSNLAHNPYENKTKKPKPQNSLGVSGQELLI